MNAALVAAGEQMVLAAEGDGADGALDRIVVDIDAAVREKAPQTLPVLEPVAHRFGDGGLAVPLHYLRWPKIMSSPPGRPILWPAPTSSQPDRKPRPHHTGGYLA